MKPTKQLSDIPPEALAEIFGATSAPPAVLHATSVVDPRQLEAMRLAAKDGMHIDFRRRPRKKA